MTVATLSIIVGLMGWLGTSYYEPVCSPDDSRLIKGDVIDKTQCGEYYEEYNRIFYNEPKRG